MARDRWGADDLVEAFSLASILDFLHASGLLDELDGGVDAIARRRRIDPARLSMLLEYVARRTDVLVQRGGSFRVRAKYRHYEKLGHLLDKVTGAFGENLRRPELALHAGPPSRARGAVNRERHADAFSRIAARPSVVLQQLIAAHGVECVLELGCGPATELIAAARANPRFEAVGIDSNRRLLSIARRRAVAADVAERIQLLEGDATRAATLLKRVRRARVGAILASSLFNELFDDTEAAPRLLRSLSRSFPAKLLFVRDYYGTLGTRRAGEPAALLHDALQLLSRQGVPPSTFRQWSALYAAAGCRVLRRIEGDGPIRWFVHVVELAYHRRR